VGKLLGRSSRRFKSIGGDGDLLRIRNVGNNTFNARFGFDATRALSEKLETAARNSFPWKMTAASGENRQMSHHIRRCYAASVVDVPVPLE